MNKHFYLWICLAGLLLSACHSSQKERQDASAAAIEDSIAKAGPQRMQVSDIKTTITYQGKDYQSAVRRQPDESLPIVVNEQGEKFVDNRISLRLTCNGQVVVSKVFTKETFASLVDARFLKYSILEGLVFDKTTPEGILYAASICYPQTDLYIPLRITVTADGQVSLAKEDLMEEPYETGEKEE